MVSFPLILTKLLLQPSTTFSPELSDFHACLKALSQHTAHPFIPSLMYRWSPVVLFLSLQKVQLPSLQSPNDPFLYTLSLLSSLTEALSLPQPQSYPLTFDTSPRAGRWKCWLVLGHFCSFPNFCGIICSRIWSSCFLFLPESYKGGEFLQTWRTIYEHYVCFPASGHHATLYINWSPP